jgi:hypothetical protein
LSNVIPGRWCVGDTPVASVSGDTNPIEACNDCFNVYKRGKTCLETSQKLIYIRSRISDMRGRRWVIKDLD